MRRLKISNMHQCKSYADEISLLRLFKAHYSNNRFIGTKTFEYCDSIPKCLSKAEIYFPFTCYKSDTSE